METSTLAGLRYACIEGCGFCCTFAPQVAQDELARLRSRFPKLPVARGDDGVMRIGLQGGCGACTLLSRRRCGAHEARPAHCRYFPFHLSFGRRAQAVVDHACRGVEPAEAGASLLAQFETDVLATTRSYRIVEQEREARGVYAEFERLAKARGAWSDPQAALAAALAQQGPPEDEAWEAALEPFAGEDPVGRPFYLASDLVWWTWGLDAQGDLQAFTMEEDGALTAKGSPFAPAMPAWSAQVEAMLQPMLRLASTRDCLEGQVFDVVDAADYEVGVAEAAMAVVAQMRADLALGITLLRRLGVRDGELGAELVRFYDARFLDAPTIGGWL